MGGILGGLFGGGGQEQQMQALKASRSDIQAYRPEAMQARLNALRAMTGGYQGANNALETLWGAPPAQNTGGAPWLRDRGPRRMMGHDLPQQPAPMAQGQQPSMFPGESFLGMMGSPIRGGSK